MRVPIHGLLDKLGLTDLVLNTPEEKQNFHNYLLELHKQALEEDAREEKQQVT